jgi:hypothetical protein
MEKDMKFGTWNVRSLYRSGSATSEYYNKEVKRLKLKVRRTHKYNKIKLGEHYQEELKRQFKQFLTAQKMHRIHF